MFRGQFLRGSPEFAISNVGYLSVCLSVCLPLRPPCDLSATPKWFRIYTFHTTRQRVLSSWFLEVNVRGREFRVSPRTSVLKRPLSKARI